MVIKPIIVIEAISSEPLIKNKITLQIIVIIPTKTNLLPRSLFALYHIFGSERVFSVLKPYKPFGGIFSRIKGIERITKNKPIKTKIIGNRLFISNLMPPINE